MLYLDLPSASELNALADHRSDSVSVSIFLPTTPITLETTACRIQLKNLAKEAIDQLENAGTDKRQVTALAEEFDDLIDDDDFWRYQAHGLAIYATPENLRTFRVANALESMVAVSDRFHLKPLLRASTFCHACYVLVLAEGGVRLIEVSADLPATTVSVSGLPTDAASSVGKASIGDRSHFGRLVGAEGQKVLLRKYARKVDTALRDLLAGSSVPLVLASTEILGAIYRSVNSYPNLVPTGLMGNAERLTDAEVATQARTLLDDLYAERIADWVSLFGQRGNEGRASTDIAQIARAATFGAVQSLLVDMDHVIHGSVDEADGSVSFAETASADTYGVVDEIARRVLLAGGEVLSVRQADIPDGKPLAAIMRFAI